MHNRFLGGALVCFLNDLSDLKNTDLGDERCGQIASALEKVIDVYKRLLPRDSILMPRAVAEMEAFRGFYGEWNDAHEQAFEPVADYRKDRILFMRNRKVRIQQLVNEGQEVYVTEIGEGFATGLYDSLSHLKSLSSQLPKTCGFLETASREFLPGATSVKLNNKKMRAQKLLEPVHEFRLCVQKLCGKFFVTAQREILDNWSKLHLAGLTQQELRVFRADFSREFQLYLHHRPSSLKDVDDLLKRCTVLLNKRGKK